MKETLVTEAQMLLSLWSMSVVLAYCVLEQTKYAQTLSSPLFVNVREGTLWLGEYVKVCIRKNKEIFAKAFSV